MSILLIMTYILSVLALLVTIRLIIGPTYFDRLIAVNLLVVIITAIMAIIAVEYRRHVYFDVALVYAVLGFVSVIAIAKYLTGRELHK